MGMDLMRSCYKSKMRPYLDRPDVEIAGEWQFCLPGAKPLPFPHRFGSQIWDWHNTYCNPAIGEATGFDGYASAAVNAKLTGEKFCGREEYLRFGSPFDAARIATDCDGLPLCCITDPVFCLGDSDGNGLQTQADGWTQEPGVTEPLAGDADDGEGGQVNTVPVHSWAGCSDVPMILYFHCETVLLCDALDGMICPLFWQPGTEDYRGTVVYGGVTFSMRVKDIAGDHLLIRHGCAGTLTNVNVPMPTCDPCVITLPATMSNLMCCIGTYTGVIDETP